MTYNTVSDARYGRCKTFAASAKGCGADGRNRQAADKSRKFRHRKRQPRVCRSQWSATRRRLRRHVQKTWVTRKRADGHGASDREQDRCTASAFRN